MMKPTLCTFITVAALSLSFNASAAQQFRTWTDDNGNTVTAKLLENQNGAVTLVRENGKEIHISISELSANDEEYVLKNTPPNMEISVDRVTDTQTQGFSGSNSYDEDGENDYQIQTRDSTYKYTLTNDGTIPYAGTIQAELYVIGYKEMAGTYVLLSKTVKDFSFSQLDDDNQFVFSSNPTVTRELQGNMQAGTEYFGNLVVLLDDQGLIFEIRGSRSKLQEYAGFIRKMQPGQVVSRNELASANNKPE